MVETGHWSEQEGVLFDLVIDLARLYKLSDIVTTSLTNRLAIRLTASLREIP